MVWKCSVPKCSSTRNTAKMHRCPRGKAEILKKWLKVIKREELFGDQKANELFICDNHFSSKQKFPASQKNRTNLLFDAIPDKNLPNEDITSPLPLLKESTNVNAAHNHEKEMGCSDVDRDVIFDSCLNSNNLREENGPLSANISDNASAPDDKLCNLNNYSVESCGDLNNNVTRSWSTPRTTKDFKSRCNLLKAVNVNRKASLTPRARKLYDVGIKFKKLGRRLLNQNISYRRKLKFAKSYVESNQFTEVNSVTETFIRSQLRLQKRKLRGRRFSVDDKILALSIFKKSPKTYKLLRKIFALPSRKVLMDLLSNIPFDVGLNQPIMESLKDSVKKLNPKDRNCILMFDEIFLEAGLNYNLRKDKIEGFYDTGDKRKNIFADHAFVFMLKGVRKVWKQPLSFFYVQSGMTTAVIQREIKNTIVALQEIGFKVIATVCDQASCNTAAINMLIQETRKDLIKSKQENQLGSTFGFRIGGQEVIPLYDPPHLLKGIRNNLLENTATFSYKKGTQKAEWSDIIQLYKLDSENNNFKICPKLTEAHVYVDKMKKMKVRLASQIFSRSLAAAMHWAKNDKGKPLTTSMHDTADFLLIFDQLFDTFNGNAVKPVHGKFLRTAIHSRSPHIKFWNEIIPVLNSMKFINKKGQETRPPSLINWVWSIKAMQNLWRIVQSDGMGFLSPRNFNQDALENFFGMIRSCGARNNNPTCGAFQDNFKTAILNNFMSPHSPGSNCEVDESIGALQSLKEFVNFKSSRRSFQSDCEYNNVKTEEFSFKPPSMKSLNLNAYISGYCGKRLLRYIKNCEICENDLLYQESEEIAVDIAEVYSFIEVKKYCPNTLLKPKSIFVDLFCKMCDVLDFFLPRLCLEHNLCKVLKKKVYELIGNDHFHCEKHSTKLFDHFSVMFIKLYIYRWVKETNCILKGLQPYSGNDAIKQEALKYYLKFKRKKVAIKNVKKL